MDNDGLISTPPSDRTDNTLTFTGIGIYQPALFGHIPKGQAAPLAPLLRHAMRQNQVIGQHFAGPWMDIGTPRRLKALNEQLRRGRPGSAIGRRLTVSGNLTSTTLNTSRCFTTKE